MQDVVGALGLTATDQLTAHDDAALGEANFFTDLQHLVPARLAQGGRDELGADVAFAEAAFVHNVHPSLAAAFSRVVPSSDASPAKNSAVTRPPPYHVALPLSAVLGA